MRKAVRQDGSVRHADSRKREVGEWYESYFDGWLIITSVEAGTVSGEDGIDKVWLHTMREATAEEIAAREQVQAEWNAKTSEERTEARIESLADRFPGLDW